jgi:hypothetical protein
MLLSMGLLVKTTKSIQKFLSDLKYGIKPHAKDWLIFPENLGKRLSMTKRLSNGELYYDQAAKERNNSSYDCWN